MESINKECQFVETVLIISVPVKKSNCVVLVRVSLSRNLEDDKVNIVIIMVEHFLIPSLHKPNHLHNHFKKVTFLRRVVQPTQPAIQTFNKLACYFDYFLINSCLHTSLAIERLTTHHINVSLIKSMEVSLMLRCLFTPPVD